MLKIDLHMHTNYVLKHFDSHINPKDLIDKASKLNFDVLAITEHTGYTTLKGFKPIKDPLLTYHHFKDYAKKKNILLIPGVEIFIQGKDVLLLNFTDDPHKYKTFDDLERLKQENVFIMAPHPYFFGASCLGKKLTDNIKLFDAIEYSHFYLKYLNPNNRAVKVASKFNKPLVATSDAHFLFAFGRNYTIVDSEKNIDSILSSLEKNKLKMFTKPWDLKNFPFLLSYQVYSNILKQLL